MARATWAGFFVGGGVLLSLLAAGCAAQTASFRPGEAQGERAGRGPNAFYTVVVGGNTLGTVKVWSQGAYPGASDDKQPVINIQLRIQNQSDAPVSLDLRRTDIEVTTDDHKVVEGGALLSTSGKTTVEPGAMGRATLLYALPQGVSLGDVAGFDFNWTLETGRGPFSESTNFVRQRVEGQRYVYWPVFGPWWWGYPYGPWWWCPPYCGPQFGFGVRWYIRPHHR